MGIHRAASLALLLLLGASTGCADDSSATDRAASSTTDTASTSAATAEGSTTLDDARQSTSTGEPGTTTEEQTTVAADESTGEPVPRARLRALHLGMGTGSEAIDVYANGEGPMFEALEFRDGTGYVEVAPGDVALAITPSGAPPAAALLANVLSLEDDRSHTLAVIGDLTGAPGMQAIGLVDDDEGVAPDSVRITFVHAAHAMGPFDVFELSGEPTALGEDLEFGHFVALGELPAQALSLGIELELDDDSALDATFEVDLGDLTGQQINLYAHDDQAGVAALVVQLADGRVLTIGVD